jgi:hypothetical protein
MHLLGTDNFIHPDFFALFFCPTLTHPCIPSFPAQFSLRASQGRRLVSGVKGGSNRRPRTEIEGEKKFISTLSHHFSTAVADRTEALLNSVKEERESMTLNG